MGGDAVRWGAPAFRNGGVEDGERGCCDAEEDVDDGPV